MRVVQMGWRTHRECASENFVHHQWRSRAVEKVYDENSLHCERAACVLWIMGIDARVRYGGGA